MAVHEELEAILARLQQMREELVLANSASDQTTGGAAMREAVDRLGTRNFDRTRSDGPESPRD